MALDYPDKKIQKVICEGSTAGTDYTEDIPVHDESATAEGKFTFDSGFPPLTSQPLDAGGYPPHRNDENGILRLFSKWLFWFQSGGYAKYDATLDYKTGCVIYHNGERYWCMADNGASSTVVTPGTNLNYWKPFTRSISLSGKASGTGTISTGNTVINVTGITVSKWDTARTLTLSGDASGSVSLDGSKNVTLATTVAQAGKVKHTLTINGQSWNGSADKTITISNAGICPIGTVLPFAGSSLPSGWLWCNGAAYSRTSYSALFAVIGTAYGYTSSSNFCVPNSMDNRFIEGSAVSARGTKRTPGLPNITGRVGVVDDFTAAGGYSQKYPTNGAFYCVSGGNYDADSDPSGGGYAEYFDASRSNSIYGNSSTVQPKALCMPYIIRYA